MGDRDLKRFLPLLLGLAGFKLLLQLTFVGGYGMFRDEFYYIACSERLAFGYVDHPPLSLFLLRGVRLVFGDSLFAIRLLPALAGAATVFLTGLMVREMRGDRFAAVLAMVGVIASPTFLAVNHVYSMNCFEILFWALAAYLVLRICNLETSDAGEGASDGRRLWLLLGLVLGLGLLNKISVLWLGVGLAVGILATPLRRKVLTPWRGSERPSRCCCSHRTSSGNWSTTGQRWSSSATRRRTRWCRSRRGTSWWDRSGP